MMLLLLYLLVFILALVLVSKLNKKNLPPSPPSLPLIGHLHLFKKPLYRTLIHISNQYGPIVYLRFGSRPVVVISSPSAAEECFTKNDIPFANRPHLLSGKHLGNNYTTLVWAPYGDHWRNLRRITNLEILSSARLNMFSGIRHDEVKLMMKCFVKGYEYQTVEMKTVFFELTLNIMMRMIAGKRYFGEQDGELEETTRFRGIVKEVLSGGGVSNIVDFLPVLKWVGYKGVEKKLVRIKGKKDEVLQELIEECRKSRQGSSTKKATLIHVMLSLQEKDPNYYTDEMIRGILWVMLSAGTDTSAGTMEWVMSLLLNNPEVIRKAQLEIDIHVEQGRLLEESDINKLPYLHCIITESLRMYPAAPIIPPHESSHDCVLGGYNIPSGTMLLVNLWAIQNDPSLWDEPAKFKPERFEGLKGVRDGFKLMPFGSGRRGCPGEALAMHVTELAVGSLIQCFDWERIGEELVDMSEGSGLTLPKAQPLEAKCRPRLTMLNHLSQL